MVYLKKDIIAKGIIRFNTPLNNSTKIEKLNSDLKKKVLYSFKRHQTRKVTVKIIHFSGLGKIILFRFYILISYERYSHKCFHLNEQKLLEPVRK